MALKIRIIILFTLCFCFNLSSFSQTDTSGINKKDSWIFELNFGRPAESEKFQFDNIELKYFFNEKIGLKLSARIVNNRNILTDDDNIQNETSKVTVFENAFLYALKTGMEYRIPLHQKVSTYCGFDIFYSQKFSESEYSEFIEYYNGINIVSVEGAWSSSGDNYYFSSFSKERALQSMGAHAVFGSDIYLYHNFFLGFELGFGYEITKYKAVHVDNISYFDDSEKNYPSYTNSTIGFNLNNLIRVGIRF